VFLPAPQLYIRCVEWLAKIYNEKDRFFYDVINLCMMRLPGDVLDIVLFTNTVLQWIHGNIDEGMIGNGL